MCVLHVCCVTEQAVTKMVQEAFSYIEKISNLDIKLKLIDTLRTVTAGKVSVHSFSHDIVTYTPCLIKGPIFLNNLVKNKPFFSTRHFASVV